MHREVDKRARMAPGRSMMQDEGGKDSDLEGDNKIIRQRIPEIQYVLRCMTLQWTNAF